MIHRLSFAMALTLTCVNAWAQEAGSPDPAPASLVLRQSSEINAPADSASETATIPTAPDTVESSPQPSPATIAPVSTPTESGAASTELPIIELTDNSDAQETIDLTDEVEDLFQRIRLGFSMPDINSDLVLYHQQWYLNRPDYLRRMIERSRPYLHHIVEELDKRDLPMELALLPMVESAYNPMAYSRAKASGLWQFIPATGKRYNLDQDWWIDERRDIVASTSAALEYLQAIYEMHGDWHLALASYNWGEGAVGRAIAKNQNLGLPTDYMSLNMPRETRNYVPKLQALKNIFSNPGLIAELNIPRVPNRPYFGTISKPTNIDVKLAARLAEIPVQEFVALNPAHNRPVIKSDTPMVIPADKFDTFVSNLEAHEESQKPLSSWQSYTMRPGDKLESIAPRFGMTVANLKAVNGIRGKIKVHPGLTLLVAGRNGGGMADMAPLPEQPRLPAADPTPAAKNGTASRTHLVRKGDTAASVAKRYHVSIAELKRINQLRDDKLKPGTVLSLQETPKRAAASETHSSKGTPHELRAAKSDKTTPRAAKQETRVAHYTVRSGDTLASIARQFRVAAADLARWNKVTSKNLKPGNTLLIQLARNP